MYGPPSVGVSGKLDLLHRERKSTFARTQWEMYLFIVYKVHEERIAQHPLTTVAEGVPLSSCAITTGQPSWVAYTEDPGSDLGY